MLCNTCLIEKSLNNFTSSSKYKTGLLPICNECRNDKKRACQTKYRGKYKYKCNFRNRVRDEDGNLNLRTIARNLWSNAKVRAKKQNVPFTITIDFVQILLTNLKCYYFEIDLSPTNGVFNHELSPTLDKIIPEKGYVPENIVLCSYKANAIKGRGSLKELKILVEKLEHLLNSKALNS